MEQEMSAQDEENRRINAFWNEKEVCEEYIGRAVGRKTEWLEVTLEKLAAGMEKSSRIFELGSGPGEEAKYLRKLGYEVEVSDVSEFFVGFLKEAGFKARLLDALTDEFPPNRDLIMAYFLLQYFRSEQCGLILSKAFRALNPGGRFSFTVAGIAKEGMPSRGKRPASGWYVWSQADLCRLLEETGFRDVEISEYPGLVESSWLLVCAEKPGFIDNG